jgi:hypothetical protein
MLSSELPNAFSGGLLVLQTKLRLTEQALLIQWFQPSLVIS